MGERIIHTAGSIILESKRENKHPTPHEKKTNNPPDLLSANPSSTTTTHLEVIISPKIPVFIGGQVA